MFALVYTTHLKNNVLIFYVVLPPVLVPRHSEWPPMHPRLPPPYHSAPQESSMPINATFPSNFRQTPGDDTPSPFRQGENFHPTYDLAGKNDKLNETRFILGS
jgi:hypothetical protein